MNDSSHPGPPADDIGAWLRAIGLEKYEDTFRRNEIDVAVLSELTSDDLRELEIPLGDRKRLLKAIAARTPAAGSNETTTNGDAVISGDAGVERRQITVLFCDLVGYTELAGRLDPEDVADVMRGYRDRSTTLIERWGGNVAKFLGDGVLAYFGWPRADEDDAARAVHAGLAVCDAVSRMRAVDGTELAARVGIATGLVMVGELIGEGASLQEAVVGATPNLAARLQALASPGVVVIAPTTRELVGDQFAVRDLGPHSIKGFNEPVRAWAVEGTGSATTRFEASRGHALSPLVGRGSESALLVAQWNRAAAGQGQVVIVSGEAGIGKSRLVLSLGEFLRGTPHVLVRAQCSPFHTTTVLHPFVEQVGRLARIEPADSAETKLGKLEAWIATSGMDVPDNAPLFATLLAIPFEGRYPPIALSPQRLRERTTELLAGFVTRLATTAPVLVIVEDIHWADPTSLAALRNLVDRITSERVLLVVTHRAGFDPAWMRPDLTTIELGKVSRDAAREMAVRASGNKTLPRSVLDLILDRTDGVPLFVEELTRTIIESGQLREAGDRFEVQVTAPHLSIPATLRDSLAARLDRLDTFKELAQVGAAIGRVFDADLLAHVMGRPEANLRRGLDQLCSAGIVEAVRGSDRRYAFRHALIQEVSYESLLKASRRTIHARIADAMETKFTSIVESHPEAVAHHLAEAGAHERAASHLLTASRRALQLAATSEAIEHLLRGLRLVERLPGSAARDLITLRLRASLGTAYMLAKGWAAPEVEEAYAAANALSHATSDAAEAVWILWGSWVHSHVRGRIDQADALSQRIRQTAMQHGDPDSRLIADMIDLQVCFYAGRFRDCDSTCASMDREFVPDRHRALINRYSTDLQLVSLVHRSIARWIQGHTDESIAMVADAERLARSLQHPYSLAWALTWGSTPLLLARELDTLSAKLEEGMSVAATHDYEYVVALCTMMLGWVKAQRGQHVQGIADMESGLSAFQATGAEIAVPHFRTLLAERLGAAARHDDALQQLHLAGEQIDRWGERWQEAEVYRVRGEILASIGEVDRSHAACRRAVDVATQQGAIGWARRAGVAESQAGR